VLAQRTGAMFAYSAKKDGVVKAIVPKGVIIVYEGGEEIGIQLGRVFGKAEGSVYPHDIVSNVAVGETFKKGKPIAYNSGFFEPDFMNPGNIIWKSSMPVTTVLYETSQTYEDSSAISKSLSGRMKSKTTKVMSFVVSFQQGIRNLLKVGTKLEPTDILMIVEDELTTDFDLFDEETITTMKKLSNKAPKAKVRGLLDKVEVFYHGSKEDMSASLRAVANASDREMAESRKAIGKKVFSGAVTDEYRVEGNPLALDTAEIKLYITIETVAGQGDKGVFGSQMKTVIGEVMNYDMITERGEHVDAVFGRLSVAKRVVLNIDIVGTTTTLLKVVAKNAVAIYRGQKK
jgi:hypothetical protein